MRTEENCGKRKENGKLYRNIEMGEMNEKWRKRFLETEKKRVMRN